jgi:hypothetical protein
MAKGFAGFCGNGRRAALVEVLGLPVGMKEVCMRLN